MGTDEDMLIRIITRRGMVHLAAVKKETSGIFAFDLLTTLRCVENLAKYYAKVSIYIKLYKIPVFFIMILV